MCSYNHIYMQLPVLLIESLKYVKGFNKEVFEAVHAAGEQVTSIRINPGKPLNTSPNAEGSSDPALSPGTVQHLSFHIADRVPWSSHGYYLPERPSFTFDPLFHAGLYYVQEASSMFVEQAVKQTADLSKPLKVLDLCAAPGGKSTLLQSLLSSDSLLVSNEVIKTRVSILEENMIKWGAANTVVTNNDPRDFQRLTDFFDVIVVDAPCSGSGLFRRDAEAIREWSLQNVELCSQRQQRILADVLPALKEDGILIYSTCSYSVDENEAIIDWLTGDMDMQSRKLAVEAEWNIVETVSEKGGYGYRFYPDKVQGEGFFIAVLQKRNSSGTYYAGRNKFEKAGRQEEEAVKEWIKQPEQFRYIKFKNEILVLPHTWHEEHFSLLSSMHIKKAGIKAGEIMNGALVPDHRLAVSGIVSDSVPRMKVSKEDAIKYLKKETIQAEITGKGWMLIVYQGTPLGWIKALPNRINNYYPKEWRIRK